MVSFDFRMKMCNEVYEGTELEDVIKTLVTSARLLHAFEDHFCQIVLVIAEKLCSDYVKDVLLARTVDWETYNETCSDDAFTHFSGGARKLSQKEYESR